MPSFERYRTPSARRGSGSTSSVSPRNAATPLGIVTAGPPGRRRKWPLDGPSHALGHHEGAPSWCVRQQHVPGLAQHASATRFAACGPAAPRLRLRPPAARTCMVAEALASSRPRRRHPRDRCACGPRGGRAAGRGCRLLGRAGVQADHVRYIVVEVPVTEGQLGPYPNRPRAADELC